MTPRRHATSSAVDVTALLSDVAGRYASARVPVHTAPGLAGRRLQTRAPRGDLTRALTNLVDNAVRHARTAVVLDATAVGHQVEVTVTDDGHGISVEDRDGVFDRFTRLDEARDRDSGGSGLGLPITQALLRRSGGDVRPRGRRPGPASRGPPAHGPLILLGAQVFRMTPSWHATKPGLRLIRHTVALMRYTTLGTSGTIVSTQCLGTMTFGAEADEEASGSILDAFAEAGGTFLDTADVYSKGVSEEITGRWLRSHPEDAARMVVATKGRFPMGEGHNDVGLSRRHLRQALDASLTRLGVEHIDLYQMHAWDAVTPLEETLRFLDDAVAAGKIGYYGFSNYLGYQVTKAVHTAREHGWTPPVTLQPQYNLLVRDIEHEVVPACLDGGLGLLPWSPLAGGWLTGKYQRNTTPTGASRLGEDPERGMEAYGPRNSDERTWAVIDAVAEVAKEQGVTSAAVALAWVAAQPAVTSVILGARTVEQLTDNLAAADLDLAADQLSHLSAVSSPRMDDYPYGAAGIAQRHRVIG